MVLNSLLGNFEKAKGMILEVLGKISGKESITTLGKINILIGQLQENSGYTYSQAREVICQQYGISESYTRVPVYMRKD